VVNPKEPEMEHTKTIVLPQPPAHEAGMRSRKNSESVGTDQDVLVERAHPVAELSTPWAQRLNRYVPIDPLPMAFPLPVTEPGELVKAKRTNPVTGCLLQADPVRIFRKYLGTESQANILWELERT